MSRDKFSPDMSLEGWREATVAWTLAGSLLDKYGYNDPIKNVRKNAINNHIANARNNLQQMRVDKK
jgi:ABC-type proline/glycine betaine transport system substrate-binding protein